MCWGWGMRRKWEHRAGLLGENAARCGPDGKGERGSIVLLARPIEPPHLCATPQEAFLHPCQANCHRSEQPSCNTLSEAIWLRSVARTNPGDPSHDSAAADDCMPNGSSGLSPPGAAPRASSVGAKPRPVVRCPGAWKGSACSCRMFAGGRWGPASAPRAGRPVATGAGAHPPTRRLVAQTACRPLRICRRRLRELAMLSLWLPAATTAEEAALADAIAAARAAWSHASASRAGSGAGAEG